MAGGPILRRARLLCGMKQSHLAELLNVNQATVSRWERGVLSLTERQLSRAMTILHASPRQASHDAALRRLVESSSQRVHLICDRTHRLMAASGPRWAQWRLNKSDLENACMIAYASPGILEAEARLVDLGWFEGRVTELIVETGPNGRGDIPIQAGRFRWSQVLLADGATARLVVAL